MAETSHSKVFTPNLSQHRIIYSNKLYRVLLSGRGEGKSTTCVITMGVHAMLHQAYLPIRWAVVRDTRRNIGITTAQTVKMWYPPNQGASVWRGKADEPEYFEISYQGKRIIEAYCFGADSLTDLNRFQSLELGGVLIEEPCPAADISGGVAAEVFAIATTSLRQMPFPIFLIAGNMPDETHWVATTWGIPGADEPEWTPEERASIEDIRRQSEVVIIPKGENRALDEIAPGYRERNEAALRVAGHAELINRLVEGKVGTPKIGEAVTPEFRDVHIADGLGIERGDRLILSWDWGLMPACVVARVSPLGHLDVVAAFQGRNEGVEQLIGRLIQPWLAIRRPFGGAPITHTGDPNGVTAEASNSRNSAVRKVLHMLGGTFTPGPVSWDDRRDPTHQALNRYISGRPWVRIDRKEAAGLIRALDGGAHYKKDPSGNIIKDGVVKDFHSHVFEAFAYLCAFVVRERETTGQYDEWKKRQAARTARAALTAGNRTGV